MHDEIDDNSVVRVIGSTLRTVAASFPGAASIAAGWSEYKNQAQENNIKDIIKRFSERIKQLESRVDEQFLNSHKLKSLIVKTCFLGKEEFIEEKRKYLGWFLAHSCLKENIEDSSKEAVLETLIKLSPFDINILSSIRYNELMTYSGDDKYMWSWEESIIREFGDKNKENIMISLCYLKSLGVVHGESEDVGRQRLSAIIGESELYAELWKIMIDFDDVFRENSFCGFAHGTEGERQILKDFREISNRINKRDILGKDEIREKINETRNKIQKETMTDGDKTYRLYARTTLGNKVLEYIGK